MALRSISSFDTVNLSRGVMEPFGFKPLQDYPNQRETAPHFGRCLSLLICPL
jgi:hypothetical protein